MCYPGIHGWTRDDGTNREITREGPGVRKQAGKENIDDLRESIRE